ncbi:BnaC05g37080D [Brassica napus]|uniref:(rape) hypothetical protein n=2 Tax=Brassica TaxID=3705 RepID=A0A078GYE2_BRANA|nr:unnamed protein product [Brassica napus]CDY30154.1 BnaC05g37080D [Brassica napus]
MVESSLLGRTLQRLVYRRDDDASGSKPCVMFDTPGLVYLEYSNVVADKYENLRLDSLVDVRLDLQLTGDQILRKNATDGVGFVPGDFRVNHDCIILVFSQRFTQMQGPKS